MSSFEIKNVPRTPDAALTFLFAYIAERREYFFTGRTIKKTRRVELEEVLYVLRYALSKSSHVQRLEFLGDFLQKAIDLGWRFDELSFLNDVVNRAQRELRLASIENHFSVESLTLVFHLDATDAERAAMLLRECREIIEKSNFFDLATKERLLARLDQIADEINGKTGKFDVILGGIVDFGDALGKFGSKVKPLFDRIREIRSLVQPTVKQYEGLPAPDETRKLPPPKNSSKAGQINDILLPKFNARRSELGLDLGEFIEIVCDKVLERHHLEVPAPIRKSTRTFLGFIRQSLNDDEILMTLAAVGAGSHGKGPRGKAEKKHD